MTPQDLIAAFDLLADAPDGVKRLRELVLSLAVRGKLVEQDPNYEPATVLIDRIRRSKGSKQPARASLGVGYSSTEDSSGARFGDLPNGWVHVRLGDIATFEYGKGLKASDRNEEGPVEVFGSNGVVGHHDVALVQSRAIVIGRKGSAGALNEARGPSWPTDVTYFVVPPDGVLLRFWFFVLESARLPELAAGIKPGLNRNEAHALPALLPPTSEQHRIVARVDELMGLLDRLEAARNTRDEARRAARDAALADLRNASDPETVETAWTRIAQQMDDLFTEPEDVAPLRQAVLELAVRGQLVAQDPRDEPVGHALSATASLPKLKHKARLPMHAEQGFPASWTVVPLGDVLSGMSAGWSPKCHAHPTSFDDEWGVLKTTSVQPNVFLPVHHKALPSKLKPRPELQVRGGEVLVTRAGPWFRVGVAAFVSSCRPRLMLSDKLIRCELISNELTNGTWIAMAINHGIGKKSLLNNQTGMDQAQMNISQSRLAATPIPLPPIAEQQRIVATVDVLMTLCDDLETRLTAAHNLHGQFAGAAVHHLDV